MFYKFQYDLLQSIIQGTLEDVKSLQVGEAEVNMPLFPGEETSYGGNEQEDLYIQGPTPLILAILVQKEDIVAYLLNISDLGIPVEGLYPIHYAVMNDSIGIINMILRKDPLELERRSENLYTPLHIACSGTNPKVVYYLLSNGADPNAQSNSGSTPLHIAVTGDSLEIICLLFKFGARTDVMNYCKKTPMMVAEEFGEQEWVDDVKQVEEQASKMLKSDMAKMYEEKEYSTDQSVQINFLMGKIRELTERINVLESSSKKPE